MHTEGTRRVEANGRRIATSAWNDSTILSDVVGCMFFFFPLIPNKAKNVGPQQSFILLSHQCAPSLVILPLPFRLSSLHFSDSHIAAALQPLKKKPKTRQLHPHWVSARCPARSLKPSWRQPMAAQLILLCVPIGSCGASSRLKSFAPCLALV